MACFTECAAGTPAPKLTRRCTPKLRTVCDSFIVAFRCDIQLPLQGSTNEAFCDWLEANKDKIMRTPKLKEFVWGAPNKTALTISDCEPDLQIASTRELTFKDLNTLDYNPITGDGTVDNNPYSDYQIWELLSEHGKWYFADVNCAGELRLHTIGQKAISLATANLNANPLLQTPFNGVLEYGKFASASVNVVLEKDKSIAKQCIEQKNVTISYLGDPNFLNKPVANVSLCPAGVADFLKP